jgi:DNA primase large subunit
MRENLLTTHLNYHKTNKKDVLPPNCPGHATAQYYKDMGVCMPDGLCTRIKNPVQYAKKRAWLLNKENSKKKGRKKKTQEVSP